MDVSFAGHYRCILDASEQRVRNLLATQVTDPLSANVGGFAQYQEGGLVHPGSAPGSLLTLVPAFLHPESSLRGSGELAGRIAMVFDFCERIQREDGTFDLITTNFHSSPDNGFIMHNLARSWKVLHALDTEDGPECGAIQDRLFSLIKRTAEGMIGGGFHTPNHRWVVAAGLALAHGITGNARLMDVADTYLAEGIDCDKNGEFTERSSGIYNAVNDNALLLLSDELERPELLEYVARNLEMMFTYFEPDGSVFTWNSTRQDKGEGGGRAGFFPTPYYHIYLMMLRRRSDPRYSWMADSIFRSLDRDNPPPALWLYLLEPELQNLVAPAEAPEKTFETHYESSGIARIRKNDLSVTVMENSSSFLFVSTPSLGVRVKMCASFFGKSHVIPADLTRDEGGFRLVFKTSGDYRLPLDPPPETSDWRDMDHSRREHVRNLDFECTLTIQTREDGVDMDIETAGCDRVPAKLEFIVDPGCVITGDAYLLEGNPGRYVTATAGMVTVQKGGNALEIGPAFADHNYTHNMRGSEPASRNEFTVYFTGFTPIKKRVTINKVL